MNFPLISEYIESIKSAEDNFKELINLCPVLGDDGQPVMTSGNFAVVFEVKDEETGKLYALKCFTKEQQGREEAYCQIADELKDVDSPYLVSLRYLEKELFVDTEQTDETEFPVLLMDWVEGKTLDKYLRENLDDKYALEMLAYRFCQLAQWLIPQPFAHGDLKPDNILVREDGTLVLVDYDGMFVPAMKGQKARELGSPDFRHPKRTEDDFDEHIDDFSLISILLSLKAVSYDPKLLEVFGASDRLLLSESDYRNISTSFFLKSYFPSGNDDLNAIYSSFILSITLDYHVVSKHLQFLLHPYFCAPSKIRIKYHNEELTMLFVKGGTYLMGAQKDNPSLPNYDKDADIDESPVRLVKVEDFWISETLVPMEMWPNCTEDRYYREIISERKNGKTDNIHYGAYGASYEECERFIARLSEYTNLHFDFPTEEEWEYAARGGHKSMGYKYAGSDNIREVAEYGVPIDGGLCAIRQRKPNELGIYDMSGCLYEWCKGLTDVDEIKSIGMDVIKEYCAKEYHDSLPEIKKHIKRGGSKSSKSEKCRVTNREYEVVYRNSLFDEPFVTVFMSDVVSGSSFFDESFKNEYNDNHFKEDAYYSCQVGLRLVLRNLNPLEIIYTTEVNKDDFENVFVDEFGVIYSADKKRLLMGPTDQVQKSGHKWTKGVLKGSYTVRSGTVCICDRAFCNCQDLKALLLPQSIRQIGKKACSNCWHLSIVHLNEGLVKIDDDAFRNCKHLHSIYLPDSVKFVGNNAFMGCMINVAFSNNEG